MNKQPPLQQEMLRILEVEIELSDDKLPDDLQVLAPGVIKVALQGIEPFGEVA